MADVFSKAKRSWVMSRVRGKHTLPERRVRSFLHRHGFRFRLHAKGLPGKPDVVMAKHRTVVFVNGCFFHGHKGCKRATTPATNKAGRLRTLGGGVVAEPSSGVVVRWPVARSSRADVGIVYLPRAARQFTSTCASPIRIWVERLRPLSRIVPVWPAPDQVMTQLDVAVTV